MTGYTYTPGIIDGGVGGDEVITGARSAGTYAFDAPDGPSLSDVFSVGKGAFKAIAPETYASVTEGIPSLGDIVGAGESLFAGAGPEAALGELAFMDSAAFGGGFDAFAGAGFMDSAAFGGGTAAGGAGAMGAMAAFGPAAAFLAWAQLMKSINQSQDTSVLLGHGVTDDLGPLQDVWTMEGMPGAAGEVERLHGGLLGDEEWIGEGDRSLVGELPIGFGNMSRDAVAAGDLDSPYWHIGGAPYSDPRLAVASGRAIAGGKMGLDVEYEALPMTGAEHGAVQRANALPVWDAPNVMPEDWDSRLDEARNLGTGEGQNPISAGLDEWKAGLDPRSRELFDSGYSRHQMYAHTGTGSPDWGAPVDDLAEVVGSMESEGRPNIQNYKWGVIG